MHLLAQSKGEAGVLDLVLERPKVGNPGYSLCQRLDDALGKIIIFHM